jgi:hypothetical protein
MQKFYNVKITLNVYFRVKMELTLDASQLLVPANVGFINQCGFIKKESCIVENLFTKVMKDHFKNRVNPIAVKDLKGGLKIKFENGNLRNEDNSLMEAYTKEVKDMNVWSKFNSVVENMKAKIHKGTKRIGVEASLIKFEELATEWFKRFLNLWDLKLEDLVIVAIKEKHVQKCKMKAGFYNFSAENIDSDVLKLIKMGKKSVPLIKKSLSQRLQIFNIELRKALNVYRRSVQQLPNINCTNLYEWLEKAIETTIEEIQYDDTQVEH